MGLFRGGGERATTEIACLQLQALPILLRRHQPRLIIEAFEVEFARFLVEPKAGEFVDAGAACQLLLVVPVSHAGPHAILNLATLDHEPTEAPRVGLALFFKVGPNLVPEHRHRAVVRAMRTSDKAEGRLTKFLGSKLSVLYDSLPVLTQNHDLTFLYLAVNPKSSTHFLSQSTVSGSGMMTPESRMTGSPF